MSETALTAVGGDELPHLAGAVRRLSEHFGVDVAKVQRQAAEIHRRLLSQARIQSFIPVLVEKELRETLRGRRLVAIDGLALDSAGDQ